MRHGCNLVVVLMIAAMAVTARGQEPPAAEAPVDQAALAQMMAKMAMPGKPHEHLQEMVGKYKTKCTWMIPGTESEMTEDGTAEFKSILGGRYVTQEFHGKMMGEPMEGFGIMGYDNAAKKFVGVWLDNMSTAMLLTEGTLDEESGVMNETGVCNSPLGPMHYKMTTKPTKNGFIFSLAQVEGTMETPLGRIEYVKQ